MRRFAAAMLVLSLGRPAAALAQESIVEYTRAFEKRDGYVPMYWDAATGRLLLEIPAVGAEFLYLTSLATGVGSNQLGLDRGMIEREAIARFDRVGNRVLLVLANPRFRAINAENPALQRSVEESFPTSTMAAFDVLAEQDGRVLVDATPYFVADHTGVIQTLRRGQQGSYAVDRDRSTIYLPRTRGFPANTEIEVSLTFTASDPGGVVRAHAPDGRAVTLRQHHSLVQLPDDGFRPRLADPRIGTFGVAFFDFARPFDTRYEVGYVARHRLRKRDPSAPVSEPIEPIVYYLDPAIPEPYRSAFRDGIAWWSRVFEAAGFRDAFVVEDMPDDMDPMDARFNVVQWVHRSDPGFSIGPAFIDPRTGEIIKAAVRMDGYRSLTDYDIYAGTLPAGGAALDEALAPWLAALDPNVSAEAFAMARRRQHAAHEVGHTLGLAHNYIASANGRASVMDYPGPLIRLVNGAIDLGDAYRDGPGAYDSLAIRFAYGEFTPEEEADSLAGILQDAMDHGILFNTDGDNATWGSYPEVTQWLNGEDAVEELARVMEVRRFLIAHFDERAIAPGEPMVWLNRRFVPVYLHHRYALEAAAKAIGGMEYRYAVRGDALPPTHIIPPERQRRALALVLDALEPDALAIPERVLRLMAPRAFGVGSDEWSFGSDAYPAFDQIGAARMLAATIVGNVLDPRRTARLVAFRARVEDAPSLEEVLAQLVDRTWNARTPAPQAPLRRVVQRVVADELMTLAGNADATVESRAAAEWALGRITQHAAEWSPRAPEDQAHRALALADIERFLNRPGTATERSEARDAPPGTPIGNGGR